MWDGRGWGLGVTLATATIATDTLATVSMVTKQNLPWGDGSK